MRFPTICRRRTAGAEGHLRDPSPANAPPAPPPRRPALALLLTLGLVALAAIVGGAGVVSYIVSVANSAPPLDTRKPIALGATSRVYAADGTRLGFIQADVLRTPVASSEIRDILMRKCDQPSHCS
jgi:hypothetical protein